METCNKRTYHPMPLLNERLPRTNLHSKTHTHTHTQTPENTLQLRIQGFMKFIGFIYEGKRLTNLFKKII